MKYTQVLVALLSSLSLLTPLHAGMQDRGYDEVLIDNVVHPHGEDIRLAVGPEGRIYLSYADEYDQITQSYIDGWVEVYSAQGELLATIEKADIPTLSSGSTFAPLYVLPGPGGIFTINIRSWSGSVVFDSAWQYDRTLDNNLGYHSRGWTQSLDGGWVTFDTNNGQLYRSLRDSSGAVLETETYTFEDDYIDWYDITLSGYTVSDRYYTYDDEGMGRSIVEELTFDVAGSLQSRTQVESLYVYDQPRLENGQVVVKRRAYRTKGDTNAIPVPQILSVVQRPETTLIDITYRVDDADDDSVTVGILASMTDDQGQTSRIPLATLVEDSAANLGAGVPTNSERTVTWDAGVDWGAAFGDVSFDLYVNDGRPLLGFHLLTLPLPDGDLTISRSPVNDLELKEALYYLWATDQGVRLDANQQLVGQGGVFEGVLLGTPEAPITAASRSWVFHQLGLQEASAAQVEAARKGFDADTVYQFTPQHPIRGDLLKYFYEYEYGWSNTGGKLPNYVNELGFDSVASQFDNGSGNLTDYPHWWVVPSTSLRVSSSSIAAPVDGGELRFTILDPNNAGWSLSTSADWLSVNGPTSGVGSALISLSAAESPDNLVRLGTVALNGGALSVSVTQLKFPDNFADRATLSGTSGSFAVNNASATLEDGEPSHRWGEGSNSLWFSYTAPADGQLSLSVDYIGNGSTYEYVSIYSGTELATLGRQRNDRQTATQWMSANQTYQIAITTYRSHTPGDLAISYQFTADAE